MGFFEATFDQNRGTPMNDVGTDYHKQCGHGTAIDEERSLTRSKLLGNKPESFHKWTS